MLLPVLLALSAAQARPGLDVEAGVGAGISGWRHPVYATDGSDFAASPLGVLDVALGSGGSKLSIDLWSAPLTSYRTSEDHETSAAFLANVGIQLGGEGFQLTPFVTLGSPLVSGGGVSAGLYPFTLPSGQLHGPELWLVSAGDSQMVGLLYAFKYVNTRY